MKNDFFSKLISNSVSEALSSLVEMSSEEYRRQKMEDELKSRYKVSSKKSNSDLTEKDKENEDEEENKENNEKKSSDDEIYKNLGIDPKKIAPIAKSLPKDLSNQTNKDQTSGEEQEKVKEPPKVEPPTKEELENPTFESIVNQINDIRSGSSMKDEIVSKNFKSYFDSLSEPEQKMLLIFSVALNQIIKGKQAASEVFKPQKFGLNVSIIQRKEKEQMDVNQDKNLEKNRNKSPELNKIPSTSDFSNPIIVGESRQVQNIIKKLR